MKVPGTSLTFDVPAATANGLDDAAGNGQNIHLNLGTGPTQLSVIGTGTQSAQHTAGTLTFSDGTTASLPIDYGDWVGTASNPISGNIVVGKSAGRLNGASGQDGQTAAIFSTAAYSIPQGRTVASLTLPVQTGDPGSAGRIHVFAIASNGTRTAQPPLSATSIVVAPQRAGADFTAALATVSGGTPPASGYTARVNWGDATPLGTATVTAGTADSPATVSGGHRYLKAGDYTVSVTGDDGVTSTVVTTTVHVT